MRLSATTLAGVIAGLSLLAGCGPEPTAPSARERASSAEAILASFDRVTLSRREVAQFRAAVVSGGSLSSAGLSFVIRNPAVASLTAGRGQARLQGLSTGRTWVVVGRDALADSVEVVVE